eukprot:TRINITY_DN200_c0_g3_i2.p1 TRINITY_DN200_c0_g3~~TRINITY_DN200_c0_g3_i2.p1  ORF type:complete len:316 (+),score=128.82 TRINITY_DN200_c0_g3_i2:28-948(+)
MAGKAEVEDFYALLGVAAGATKAEVKKAYRKKALQYHPDKNKGNARAAELFVRVHKAKEVLLDQAARKAYDDVRRANEERVVHEMDMDSARKRMADSLLEKERAYKKQKTEAQLAKQRLDAEIERLRKEGYQKMIRKQQERERMRAAGGGAAARTGPLTIKAHWDKKLNKQAPVYTQQYLTSLFGCCGTVEAVVMAQSGSYALISFTTSEMASKAMSLEIVGCETNPLTLSWIKPPPASVTPPPPEQQQQQQQKQPACKSPSATDPVTVHLQYEQEVMKKLLAAAAAQKQRQQQQEKSPEPVPTPK